MNALLLGVFDQWWVWKVRVTLNLKGRRNNASGIDDSFELEVIDIYQLRGRL